MNNYGLLSSAEMFTQTTKRTECDGETPAPRIFKRIMMKSYHRLLPGGLTPVRLGSSGIPGEFETSHQSVPSSRIRVLGSVGL
jgi:hypothetical protein